jgi:hypothetical protein
MIAIITEYLQVVTHVNVNRDIMMLSIPNAVLVTEAVYYATELMPIIV